RRPSSTYLSTRFDRGLPSRLAWRSSRRRVFAAIRAGSAAFCERVMRDDCNTPYLLYYTDLVSQHADAVDLRLDDIAVLQVLRRRAREPDAGGRAGEDHVAGKERPAGRRARDDLGHGKEELVGARVLLRDAVDPQRETQ